MRRKTDLPRTKAKTCAWCGTRFVPNGPNGAWPCCSKTCYRRLQASRTLPRERDDLDDPPLFAENRR